LSHAEAQRRREDRKETDFCKKSNIKEAIALHIEGLKEEGLSVPEPTTNCQYVDV
jgi:hypothetical protein